MAASRNNIFTTVTTQGGLFPPEFLQKICEQKSGIEGLSPESYHLVAGRRLNEAINDAWSPVKRNWAAFKAKADALGKDDPAIGLTRDQWLLPLFQELGFGRLQRASATEIDGAEYPISHIWQHVPIHLTGWNVDTDKRQSGVAGSARMAPHSMMQELLNRSDKHLWGFVSNGRVLRILRDNVTMTRQAYVEFDLVAMLEGDVYSGTKGTHHLRNFLEIRRVKRGRYILTSLHAEGREEAKRSVVSSISSQVRYIPCIWLFGKDPPYPPPRKSG